MKELIWVYNWIAPDGPLHNYKNPSLYDFAKFSPEVTLSSAPSVNDQAPVYCDIKRKINSKIVSPFDYDKYAGKKFLYDITLSNKENHLRRILDINHGFLEQSVINGEVLTEIKEGQGYFVLSTIYESFLDDSDFHLIHKYFNHHHIPLNKIIYLTNCVNGKEIYNNFCERKRIDTMVNIEYVGLYLSNLQNDIAKNNEFEKRQNVFGTQDRLFLNWNRRIRDHRSLILANFLQNNLMDQIHMSFDKDLPFDHWMQRLTHHASMYNLELNSKEFYEEFYHSLPLILDSNNLHKFPVEDDFIDPAEWYDKTFISLSSETYFRESIIHMTEKTMKPIIFKHPFITIGPKHTLKYIKKMGFKTFNDYWNEDYDEDDYQDRMNKIIQICKDINNWDNNKLQEFHRGVSDRLEYNFKLFQNLRINELDEFLHKYGEENG
jgi:hypothetical protein